MQSNKKTKLKKGDEVVILAGKDRGKKGKILKSFPISGKILIEGLNLAKKHRKPKKQGEKGEIVSLPRPIDASNVSLYCSSCGKARRFGFVANGENKIRICKKCNQNI